MNGKLRKELLAALSISTSVIFLVSGCGIFKSSQKAEPGKSPVVEQPAAGEKKASAQPAVAAGGQSQEKDLQGQAKEAAQPASQEKVKEDTQNAKVKTSGKQSRATGDTYIVKKGDSLWKIAKAVYNKPLKWKTIYKANKKQIKNPDRIYPNQKLVIPGVK